MIMMMIYLSSVAMEQQILSLKAQLRAYKKHIQVCDVLLRFDVC